MKKWFFWLLVGCVFHSTQCTTDFDLTADYKEITTVYGLISQNDQTHYIRIQRAFIDEKTSAFVLAQNPDSIYYQDILTVTVQELKTGKIYTLQRIDGDTLTPAIKKDPNGIFANTPNILYRFSATLDPSSEYLLQIVHNENGRVLTSTTGLVKDFQVTRPFEKQSINWLSPTNFFAYWTLAENSKIYDLVIRLHYATADHSAPFVITGNSFVDWRVFKNQNFTEDNPKVDIPGLNFYQGIKFILEPTTDEIRYFDSLSFIFSVGTPMLSDYINYNQAQSGITQNEISSQFTNINGGLGIFSARFDKIISGVKISDNSLDSLACGPITGGLGFAPSLNLSKYPNYPFCN